MTDGLDALLGHMRSTGYSEGYVRGMGLFAARLAEAAPGLSGWDEARTWCARFSGEGRRIHSLPYLEIARQYVDLGVMPRSEGARRHVRTKTRDTLCAGLAEVLDAYEASPEAASKKPSTVAGELSNASAFLARLEARGVTGPSDATEDDVLAVLTAPDGGPAWSPSHVKQVVAVLRGASGVDGVPGLLAKVVVPRGWRKLKEALTEDEAARVAEALDDPSSGLSLRDRAIGCALLYTGMRACDIAALEASAIDWDRDLIAIEQLKTGEPLEIPLPARLGNAILDYAEGERGETDSPYVFVSGEWPHGQIDASVVYNVSCLVLDAAGVRTGAGDRRGTHIFRRRVVTAMLGGGVDRAVAASVVGHRSPSVTDTYMVATVEGLRRCALDPSRFPVRKGALDHEGI